MQQEGWGGTGVRPGGNGTLRDLGSALVGFLPIVVVLLGLIAGVAVALLKLADELVLFASDGVPVIVGELAPFLAHLAFHLFPISLNSVPVHLNTSCLRECIRRASG